MNTVPQNLYEKTIEVVKLGEKTDKPIIIKGNFITRRLLMIVGRTPVFSTSHLLCNSINYTEFLKENGFHVQTKNNEAGLIIEFRARLK